jgi:hypothetical protein
MTYTPDQYRYHINGKTTNVVDPDPLRFDSPGFGSVIVRIQEQENRTKMTNKPFKKTFVPT